MNVNYIFIVIILKLFFLLQACKTTEIYSDYDRNAPFLQYGEYMVMEYMKSLPVERTTKKHIYASVKSEMNKRGYSESKDPDLLVKIMITSKDTEATGFMRHNDFYRGSTYYPYGWGVNTGIDKISYQTYTEGSIIIGIIDRDKKQMIWQGGAKHLFTDNRKNRKSLIRRIITKVFENYPVKPLNTNNE